MEEELFIPQVGSMVVVSVFGYETVCVVYPTYKEAKEAYDIEVKSCEYSPQDSEVFMAFIVAHVPYKREGEG